MLGSVKYVGGDDVLKESLEFVVGEGDVVETFEFFAEVEFEGVEVADVGTIGVLKLLELLDELLFELCFRICHVFLFFGG